MDRRRHRRFALMLPAVVRLGSAGVPVQGRLLDLSENGASVSVGAAPDVGGGVYLRFLVFPDVICEATGTVIRLMPLGREHGVAVEFAYANPSLLNFLRNLEVAHEAARPDILRDIRDLVINVG